MPAERTAPRTIPPSPLSNFRDLGGVVTIDGVVRSDVLWRSDDASFVPAAQADELIQRGLTTLIDLRSGQERAATGRGVFGTHSTDYHHIPLTDHMALPEALAAAMLRGATTDEVGRWYADIVEHKSQEIVRALEIIASAEGATLFYCSAGKDRTGVLAAVLLAALGAGADDIVADYARTELHLDRTRARLRPLVTMLIGRPPAGSPSSGADETAAGDDERRSRPTLGARPESMRAMLEELESRGGVLEPLFDAGLTDETRSRLRTRSIIRA